MLCRTRAGHRAVVGAMLISALGVIGVAIEQTIRETRPRGLGPVPVRPGDRRLHRAGRARHHPWRAAVLRDPAAARRPSALVAAALCLDRAVAGVALVGSYTRTGWISLIVGLIVIGVDPLPHAAPDRPLVLAAVVLAVPSTVQRFNDLSQGPQQPASTATRSASGSASGESNLPKVNQCAGDRARWSPRSAWSRAG